MLGKSKLSSGLSLQLLLTLKLWIRNHYEIVLINREKRFNDITVVCEVKYYK